MATSSIIKTFIIEDEEHINTFADAIEESYQESLHRPETCNVNITYLSGSKDIRKFMTKRKIKAIRF